MTLQAPFPWFGGKSRIASAVWERFGAVENYVEPFFGSGAVLLARPDVRGTETINDACGFVANFWRAIRAAPDQVAEWCDWPTNEADLEARHYWLITEGRNRLKAALGNPHGFEPQVAGYWCWGLSNWIGSGWCDGDGPWQWTDGSWAKQDRPHLSGGKGINRQLPHLSGRQGVNKSTHLGDWFTTLADRLRNVRVAYGDWSRVCGDSVTWRNGLTAVFLDPPYSADERFAGTYTEDDGTVAAKARDWAIEAGKRRDMRIALCGYEGEHAMPSDWMPLRWKAVGGYGSQGDGRGRQNAAREVIWFSPACVSAKQVSLFDMLGAVE